MEEWQVNEEKHQYLWLLRIHFLFMVLERRLKCREKLRAEKQVLLWQSHNAKVSTLR